VDYALPVTTVGSHDTASAVVGVPADNPRFGYISCGTWGLVGVELDAPVLTEDSRKANFTNERGVDGTIRYLRNVMGLWLLSESMRTWDLRGRGVDLGDVLAACGRAARGRPRASTRTTRCSCRPATCPSGSPRPPGCGTRSPRSWCAASSTASPSRSPRPCPTRSGCPGSRWRSCTSSGGGSQNALLCQLTADASGRPVVAGPVEATALGNVLVQARTHGVLSGGPGRAARAGARGEPPAPLRAEVTAWPRYCFQLQVRPERLAEYRERTARCGRRCSPRSATPGGATTRCSSAADGMLIGYVESDDLAASQGRHGRHAVNARWQAEMAPFFVDLDGRPDEGFLLLDEVFHLEDQLGLG
jgi:L-rhamnose mutarotase